MKSNDRRGASVIAYVTPQVRAQVEAMRTAQLRETGIMPSLSAVAAQLLQRGLKSRASTHNEP